MTSKELIGVLIAIDPTGEMPVRVQSTPRHPDSPDPGDCRRVVGVGYDAADDAVNLYVRGER